MYEKKIPSDIDYGIKITMEVIEYSLTEAGRTLLPLIVQLEKWGDDFRPVMKQIIKLKEDPKEQSKADSSN